eukprot:255043-Karenia_brevis.AAC.1
MTQLKEEKIKIPLDQVVAECFIVKNMFVSVSGASPYQALYGRVPPLLAEFEPASEGQVDDASAGIPGISRHHHPQMVERLRLQHRQVNLQVAKEMSKSIIRCATEFLAC